MEHMRFGLSAADRRGPGKAAQTFMTGGKSGCVSGKRTRAENDGELKSRDRDN
jgi:hypothetical protein